LLTLFKKRRAAVMENEKVEKQLGEENQETMVKKD
jgi:hypothetical protein